ncbi:MAG: hypothetical protein NC244_04030 [Alistipes senegalensis]|nr:hypothetical protein [Alistipes senegalensis]
MNNKYQNSTYALRNNELVYIEDVESGLSCNYVCPACKGKLIARKGNKNSHHFAHQSADCGKGYETALHLLAKEILSEANEITTPPVYIETDSHYPNIKLFPELKIKIDHVELEKKIDNIIPDIILTSGNRQLIIEIKVTHKVDDKKLEKIRNTGISAIEIDLSKYDRIISKSELKEFLIKKRYRYTKKWLYNRLQEKYYNALCDFSEEKLAYEFCCQYLVEDCPVYKTYTRRIEKCMACMYLIKINYNKFERPKGIICSGKNRISTKEDLIKCVKKQFPDK